MPCHHQYHCDLWFCELQYMYFLQSSNYVKEAYSDMSEGGGDWVRLEVKKMETIQKITISAYCAHTSNPKVGGRIMATSRTTLTSCPSSVLARCAA